MSLREPPQPDAPPADFLALLDYLRRTRGFDFSGYKPASLMRRIQKRMQAVRIEGYTEYVDYLEVHPEEFEQLFNTVLINVTTFFRDTSSWEVLAKELVPKIVAGREPPAPIRVWSAGCASGEEAYTLAMVLAEAMGPDAFRDRVKVYATDLDEEALAHARHAAYSAKDVENVPPEYLARYFDEAEGRYTFRPDLRRSVIFGRHDLMQDAPISRVDLLVCRNALMYLNAEAQSRILIRFHFALNEGGILFLGRAETLLTRSNLFAPVDLKRRLFTKVTRPNLRDRLLITGQPEYDNGESGSALTRLREAAFDAAPVAQLFVDQGGFLVLANERARSVFGLTLSDLGRPLQDLEVSYRPVELRSLIERVNAEGRTTVVRDVDWPALAGDARTFDVQVMPLRHDGATIGVSVLFMDVTATKRLQRELETTHQELESAYEELQSTNEELETTNEELQSTVEELETTNEELQSTNEELETMNEELQSTNEELQTINDELRRRSEELDDVNAFLESILTSLRGGVVVVDRDLKVLVWNERSEDLWGVRQDETVGRHFLNLDIGLPVQELRQPIRACLSGEDVEPLSLEATNRRGKQVALRVTIVPLTSTDPARSGVNGAILLME